MVNRQKIINDFKDVVRCGKLKVTPQRLAVLENLMDNPSHRECEEIFRDLQKKGEVISRATIYRTLDLAVKYGFARKLDIGEGKARYENRLNENHHDHLICIKCGSITEFYNQDIERIQKEICENKKYLLVKHSHQLFGICSKCQKK